MVATVCGPHVDTPTDFRNWPVAGASTARRGGLKGETAIRLNFSRKREDTVRESGVPLSSERDFHLASKAKNTQAEEPS
jgi:hypothetical protein